VSLAGVECVSRHYKALKPGPCADQRKQPGDGASLFGTASDYRCAYTTVFEGLDWYDRFISPLL